MTFSIYALRHPSTFEVKYIGLSTNPAKRLTTHVAPSAAPAVRDWIGSLGSEPDLTVLETSESEVDAKLKEQIWIARFPSKQLLNATRGGDVPRRDGHGGRFSGIGERVKSTRESKSIGQHELSRICGVAASIISRIEGGKYRSITAETAVLLARALNVSVEYLVTGES